MSALRALARRFARTPLHPQWLLGRREPPAGLRDMPGLVLDIGSADQWIARHLASDATYVGLDYPPTGRTLYGARPQVFGDAGQLPFRDGSFDVVVCLEVLEHVREPDQALRELARVLRPGGRAFVSMPFLYPVHDAPHDYQRWTESGWRRSANAVGLEVEALRRRGSALRTAGLLACLAIAGPLGEGPRWRALALLPPALLAVLACNLVAVALDAVWPRWDAMPGGLELDLRRP
jgi:SAM-dependent methyltransferase